MEDQLKTLQEIKVVFDKYQALQWQRDHPTRDGMISALKGAAETAAGEVSQSEYLRGNIYSVPWESISDYELYNKLSQYQQALVTHCINKFGESVVKQYIDAQMKNGH